MRFALIDTRPDARPDARPDTRPDTRPDARPGIRPDVSLGVRPDVSPDDPTDMKSLAVQFHNTGFHSYIEKMVGHDPQERDNMGRTALSIALEKNWSLANQIILTLVESDRHWFNGPCPNYDEKSLMTEMNYITRVGIACASNNNCGLALKKLVKNDWVDVTKKCLLGNSLLYHIAGSDICDVARDVIRKRIYSNEEICDCREAFDGVKACIEELCDANNIEERKIIYHSMDACKTVCFTDDKWSKKLKICASILVQSDWLEIFKLNTSQRNVRALLKGTRGCSIGPEGSSTMITRNLGLLTLLSPLIPMVLTSLTLLSPAVLTQLAQIVGTLLI